MDVTKSTTPRSQWHPRGHIHIFICTLHLLELDLLPDFPDISESTFHAAKAPTNLQQRVKGVEWALYRLFELHDPEETRTTLKPHFPPSTPKASLGLRAALYKSLTELKKNGVLPREIVLRKTMLDECKGEKFEELLAAFAMVVLRQKVDTILAATTSTSQLKRKTSSLADRKCDAEHIVPLILAHRVLLQKSLAKRQDLREKAAVHTQELETQRQDIARRTQIVSQNDELEQMSDHEYEALKGRVNTAFARDRRWAKYILEGDGTCTPFEEDTSRRSKADGGADRTRTANEPMMQILTSMSKRRDHIEDLNRLRDSLLTSRIGEQATTTAIEGAPGDDRVTKSEGISSGPRFSKHQSLTLGVLPTQR
ncbi:hypothetical protein LTR20_008580 [Exophiala xenobiotica]|nr:hypothetical protein LTS06_011775 [Exophiala xenobiotica]KAK5279720.1 hypothetical protein LTR40_007388 [Exophiala xenobiotica]KAK5384278.1 hypothetical protein LTS13_002472 [Exophiala xenobiotica]KAK5399402.1 hypothetical protein LTR79_003038 [Exophiala xenobiotica]KAK5416511.1 hypothetical protein LTR90_005733 [Exophiala xenobiotica]